jgi:1,4-dihydroxy-2-naphthoate polyprenyltransferase
MRALLSWIQASRPPSQLYIFLPLLVGESFYLKGRHPLHWGIFALVHAFGLFIQLFIVYANDVADQETDRLNRTHTVFSGGSRVLVENKLSRARLKRVSVLMGVLTLATALVLALAFERLCAPLLAGAGLGLLYMYSFPPFRISYRGGGELLQTAGVGLILPLYGYYGQQGALTGFPVETLGVILPTELACAVATALPDASSDRLSNKRTAVVRFGGRAAQVGIIVLNALSIAAFYTIFKNTLVPGALMWLLAVPLIGTFALALGIGAGPGEWRLSLFVGIAIAITLSFLGALSLLPLVATN